MASFVQTFDRWFGRTGFSWERSVTLLKFMAVGLPAFILAVPLNYALVEYGHLAKAGAYAIVVALQVVMNFFMCRFLVFERKGPGSLWAEFGAFFTGIMFFRFADWGVYVLLVSVAGLYYLAVQLMNVALFGVVKFIFSERVFIGRRVSPEIAAAQRKEDSRERKS